jgi:hypothetical protein
MNCSLYHDPRYWLRAHASDVSGRRRAPCRRRVIREQMAIDATLARLEREALLDAAPAIYAILGRSHSAAAPAPVVMPEPAPPLAPEPLPVRPVAPDLPFDMRQRLGLH